MRRHTTPAGYDILVGAGVVTIQELAPDIWRVGSMYFTDSEHEAKALQRRYEDRRMAKAPKNAKNTGRKQVEEDEDDEDEDEDDEPSPKVKKLARKPTKGGKVNAPESEDEDDDEDEDDEDEDEDEDEPAPKGKKSAPSKSGSKKSSKSDDEDDDEDEDDEDEAELGVRKSKAKGPDVVLAQKHLQLALDALKPK